MEHMEQSLIDVQLTLLKETVAYYSQDISRRAQDPASFSCEYETGDGRCCAVGRLLPQRWRINGKLFKRKSFEGYIHAVFDQLPDDVQKYGSDYLLELQRIHDERGNWSHTTGLTQKGKSRVEEFENDIRAGKYLPKK